MGVDRFDEDVLRWLGVVWGKSPKYAGGQRMHLLVAHLLDTAAVAELMWDEFLAPCTRKWLDEVSGGRGRAFFAWLCGIHDVGKATPSHQRLWDEGAVAVRAAGLDWCERTVTRVRWRHDRAGGLLLTELLPESGWARDQVDWVWPVVAGHHGTFPSEGQLRPPRRAARHVRGGSGWARVQRVVVEWVTGELGFADLISVQPVAVPSRAQQLKLSDHGASAVSPTATCLDRHRSVGQSGLFPAT